MPIEITNVPQSNIIVIITLIAILLLTFRKSQHNDVLAISVTEELKGFGILTVVFAHFAYMKVTNSEFLFPLSVIAGVGVDLFLFMSGFGLTLSMMKKPMAAVDFYKRRLIKIFIPFWITLILLFVADAVFLDTTYGVSYMIQSALGWFPTAKGYGDVNSPFWYITWMIMFYALFPIFFNPKKPWIVAIILAVIATLIGSLNPLNLADNWLHRLHTLAFSLGIIAAWILKDSKEEPNKLVAYIKSLRDNNSALKYIIMAVMLVVFAYMSLKTSAGNWPTLVAIFTKGFYVEQLASLVIMFALIVIFVLKKYDNKFLSIFGLYSFEVYLIHWPLIARYDVFFDIFPAWGAVIAWMITFLIVSWILQKLVKPVSLFIDKLVN